MAMLRRWAGSRVISVVVSDWRVAVTMVGSLIRESVSR
jgi:hypothetical protein